MIHTKPVPGAGCQCCQVGIEYSQVAWLGQQHTAQQAQQSTLAAPACALHKDALSALYPKSRDRQTKTVLARPLENKILNIDNKRTHDLATTSIEWIEARALRWIVPWERLQPHQGAAGRGIL